MAVFETKKYYRRFTIPTCTLFYEFVFAKEIQGIWNTCRQKQKHENWRDLLLSKETHNGRKDEEKTMKTEHIKIYTAEDLIFLFIIQLHLVEYK